MTVDDHDPGTLGARPEAEGAVDERDQGPDRAYTWEGKPGEDFGPIAPPTPGPARRERRPASDAAPEPRPVRHPASTPGTVADGAAREPGGAALPAPRRRPWRPILAAVGALTLLGALAAGALLLISRQAAEPATGPGAPPAVQSSPIPTVASPGPGAASSPAAAPPASPAAGSPTPLALAPATVAPTPLPTRSPVAAAATTRPSPVIVPALGTQPALRFPTSTPTPVRAGTLPPIRTPPPVPTTRPVTVLTRVWSDQVLHRVGDQASICGAAATGANAQLTVIAPDQSTRTLGEFQPPSERVCFTMRLDQPGLYVLSLIVKDAGGTEIDRQSGALSAGR